MKAAASPGYRRSYRRMVREVHQIKRRERRMLMAIRISECGSSELPFEVIEDNDGSILSSHATLEEAQMALDLKQIETDRSQYIAEEHGHPGEACSYLGMDLWDCGHIDNEGPSTEPEPEEN